MGINSLKKSSRLLQSRRYTHDSFTDAQETFTSVLDINATEVYTDQILIPSSSLPFSEFKDASEPDTMTFFQFGIPMF